MFVNTSMLRSLSSLIASVGRMKGTAIPIFFSPSLSIVKLPEPSQRTYELFGSDLHKHIDVVLSFAVEWAANNGSLCLLLLDIHVYT